MVAPLCEEPQESNGGVSRNGPQLYLRFCYRGDQKQLGPPECPIGAEQLLPGPIPFQGALVRFFRVSGLALTLALGHGNVVVACGSQ